MIACATSYQKCSREISIPLNWFVFSDYFLSNCDDRTAIAFLGRGPGSIPAVTLLSAMIGIM